jgi:cytochrome c
MPRLTVAHRRGPIVPLAAAALLVVLACGRGPGPTATPTRNLAGGGPEEVRLAPAPNVAGDPNDGRRLFVATGCGGCHTLPAIPAATGVIGPNLTNVVLRPTLAGETIEMSPDNLIRFLLDPAALKPGTSMPNLGLSEQQARDIAAYMYSQPHNPGR